MLISLTLALSSQVETPQVDISLRLWLWRTAHGQWDAYGYLPSRRAWWHHCPSCDPVTGAKLHCLVTEHHNLFARITRKPPNFLCMLPVAVARSSFDGVSIRYVLPVYGWRHVFIPWDQWADDNKAAKRKIMQTTPRDSAPINCCFWYLCLFYYQFQYFQCTFA